MRTWVRVFAVCGLLLSMGGMPAATAKADTDDTDIAIQIEIENDILEGSFYSTSTSTPYPAQYSNAVVWVELSLDGGGDLDNPITYPVKNFPVHTVWNYRTTTSYVDWYTGDDGKAAMVRNIGGASCNFTVRVDIYLGISQHQVNSVYFTPRC